MIVVCAASAIMAMSFLLEGDWYIGGCLLANALLAFSEADV